MASMSSLRMPQSLTKRLGVDTGEAVLRYELLEEQAATLGRMGEKLEQALAVLARTRARDGPRCSGRRPTPPGASSSSAR